MGRRPAPLPSAPAARAPRAAAAVPRARYYCSVGQLDRARSRLYRGQILQQNMRWKALAEIYTMHSFAPFWNRSQSSNFSQKSLKCLPKCLQNVCQILLNFIKQASKSTGIKKRSIENSFEVEDVANGFHFSRHNHQPNFVKISVDVQLAKFCRNFAGICPSLRSNE